MPSPYVALAGSSASPATAADPTNDSRGFSSSWRCSAAAITLLTGFGLAVLVCSLGPGSSLADEPISTLAMPSMQASGQAQRPMLPALRAQSSARVHMLPGGPAGDYNSGRAHRTFQKEAATSVLPKGRRSSTAARAATAEATAPAQKKTLAITGASSGLGLQASRALIESGNWHVIMGVRDPEKAKLAAEELGFPEDAYEIEQVELSSLDSVRKFAEKLKQRPGPLDTLVCNAAVYLPAQDQPLFTPNGFETSAQVNHLSHFLLFNELMPKIQQSKDPRILIVGSITGNTNTVGGGAVWPWASLGKLNGLAENDDGKPNAMMDGGNWNGAKAYKDSKLANMMTVLEAHRRFHDKTGITFSSMYPGCIAETGLFRDKRPWFRKLFPLFMKYVTGGYVSEPEAGDRLFEVVDSERTKKSGVYWGWNGAAKTVAYLKVSADKSKRGLTGAGGAGGEINEVEPSGEVQETEKAKRLWELSAKAVGLPYDKAYVDVLPENAAEIAAKNAPKSLPGIPLPSFVQDYRGKLDKRAREGTSSQLTEAQGRQ